jgi:hypothetical protein
MKTKLASVLGLAVLVACFTCGSSFVYADAPEAAPSVMQTLVPDADANGAAVVDQLPCGDAQVTEAGQSPSAVTETEASTVEASPAPAIQSADAIIVEVTQTVTIVVPGEDAADSEEPAVTGSIAEPTATATASVVEAAVTEASPAPATEVTEATDAIVVEVAQTVTIAAPGQDPGDSEAQAVTGSNPEPSATEPALTLDAELP